MKIRFWGTRGSIPVPGKDTIIYGGNTSCVEITLESGGKIIVDSGTGIRPLGEELLRQEKEMDIHLLITHIHWDHVNGFPFFSPIHNSKTKIIVDGFPSCMKGLTIPFENKMYDGFFPLSFSDLKAQIVYLDKLKSGPIRIEEVVIDNIPLKHPQGGFGFRFFDGKKTFVFITDNELTDKANGIRHHDDYVEFCRNADILVHDAQYTPEEMISRRGWGHSDHMAAVNLAAKAHAKRLVLFHHDPARKDPDVLSIVTLCREFADSINCDAAIEAATEGMELVC